MFQLKEKKQKKILSVNSNQKRARMAALTSDYFKSKIVTVEKGYFDKIVNPFRRYKNYKHICTEQQSLKTYEAKTYITERKIKQIYKNSWRLC